MNFLFIYIVFTSIKNYLRTGSSLWSSFGLKFKTSCLCIHIPLWDYPCFYFRYSATSCLFRASSSFVLILQRFYYNYQMQFYIISIIYINKFNSIKYRLKKKEITIIIILNLLELYIDNNATNSLTFSNFLNPLNYINIRHIRWNVILSNLMKPLVGLNS